MNKKVSVIIVNYNTFLHCVECIRSLLKQINVNLQIIVVDNNSNDQSSTKLKEIFGNNITIIVNEENVGFAKANNIGAKIVAGDYIACVNPDIKLESNNVLFRLVEFIDSDNEYGVIAPKVVEQRKYRIIKPKKRYPQHHLLKFTTNLNSLPGNYAWLLGAFLLFQTKVYKEINGFDEDYFLYGEDTDICLKVRKAGYKIDYIENVEVHHWSGASEVSSDNYSKWVRKKNGYYQFCLKNYHQYDFIQILKHRLISCRFKKLFLATYYLFNKENKLEQKLEKVNAEIEVINRFKYLIKESKI